MGSGKTSFKDQGAVRSTTSIERSTLYSRWIALASIAITLPWYLPDRGYLIMLGAVVLVYNLALTVVWTRSEAPGVSMAIFLLADYALLGGLLLLTGGIHSPYYFILAGPLITMAYWRSTKSMGPFVGLAALSLAITAFTTWWSPLSVVAYSQTGAFIGYAASLLLIAFLVDTLAATDRVERNQAVVALRQAEAEQARLEIFLNSISEAVLAVDEQGKVTLSNSAALNLFNKHGFENIHISKLLKLKDSNDKSVDIMDLASASPSVIIRDDLRFTGYDGSEIKLQLSIAPVRTKLNAARNRDSSYILVMRDITKAKDLEQERDEFISITSHELRTPVATAEASLSMLIDPKFGSKEPQTLKFAKMAHESVVFLGELIADLETLSNLKQHNLEFTFEEVASETLLTSLADEFLPIIEKKGLSLKIQVEDDLPTILSSRHLIKEVLQNFMNNAIKYSEKGSITLSAEQSKAPRKGITFSVKDEGIGIAASDKPLVFQKFFRSEDYRTRTTRGTGLGLYLCQNLSKRLNGDLWFTSELNHGSAFYLSVPPASHLAEDKRKVTEAKLDSLVNNL